MFTGIVKLETQLTECVDTDYGKRLSIVLPADYSHDIELGASIALNGACLTVVKCTYDHQQQALVSFDVIPETLKLTNLADVDVGAWINIERAAKMNAEIGGHLLSGHIHAQAQLENVIEQEKAYSLQFSVPEQWSKYVLHKGYIGLNGCSLTIGEVDASRFWIHLIPETLSITNFDKLKTGDKVNLEIDSQTQAVIDTVERVLASKNLI
ncbi:riboflavin synthase subunit alpha [Catenovulum sp. SM1970]|uniref:riboflavin synthase subunit alpha n=1 Tax=Marinifaba aquimaris TaxID=2741323 RepID=UPI001574E85A|nr:riboflavin synthase subunit alpha [Marinifaba aquimaris]NTS78236.1 riboflavin synthase subunit alpha [Marinifaba aquimaris]